MKKIAYFFLTVTWVFIIMASYSVFAKSEELTAKDFDLYVRNVPVVCGDYKNVLVYLEYFDFEPVYTSVGKVGSKKDGAMVYGVILYMNTDKTQMIPVMGVPNQVELCMMYRSFEVKEFNAEE